MNEYQGRDNLAVMALARNYNNHLVSIVHSASGSGEHLVDFGAGQGTFALALAKMGHHVECVEPDSVLSGHVRSQGMKVYTSLDEIPASTVDVLYTLNVLEHIEDDESCLRAFHEKIKPQGTLVIYVPAFQLLYSSMDAKVGHFRRYTRKELQQKVERSGFQLKKCVYVDSLGFFASLAYRFIGSDSGEISPRSISIYDRYIFPLSRILDKVLSRLMGKNLLLVAVPLEK